MISVRAQISGFTTTLVVCLSYWLIVFLAGLTILAFRKDISADYLLRDTSVLLHAPPYVGMISNIGIMTWVAAGAIFLFVSYVISKRNGLSRDAGFTLAFGLFTLVLALDDLFRLHERVFPLYLGIPENFLYASYAVIVATILFKYRHLTLKTDYLLLATASFFSASPWRLISEHSKRCPMHLC